MQKALSDIVVLDLARYLTGPFAAYLMGHLGANVIKIEKPYSGEDYRMFHPQVNGESLVFPSCNINKRSLCLNLRDPRAKEILMRMLPKVDVLIQNFRAGTIEKMGFDWETIHAINPRLIMANFSGYGQDGPYCNRVAFDSIILSESGLVDSIMLENDSPPCYPGGDCGATTAALNFTCTIMAALAARDRTGEGQYLEVDMMSSVSRMFSPEISLYQASGQVVRTNDLAPCAFFRDCEGSFVQISCPARLWETFRSVTGIPELSHADFTTLEDRQKNKAALNQLIQAWAERLPAAEIVRCLEAEGIGAGIVRNYKDLIVNEHVKAIQFFQQIDVPYIGLVPYPDMPFSLSASPLEFGAVPKIGQHNHEVLKEFLGMEKAEVDALLEEGILYQAEHARWK